MDPARGLLETLTELGETALQRGIAMAMGLSAGLEDLDPADLPNRAAGMAGGVVDQGRANTDLIVSLVRSEVDKAVGRIGVVREEELAALRRHVERLEAALAAAGIDTRATEAPVKKVPAKKVPAKKVPVKKAPTSTGAQG